MSAPAPDGAATIAAYDAVAAHYEELCRAREPYLRAVERIVADAVPDPCEALLDVGSGGGSRAVRIARRRSVGGLVLSDPSASMAAACRRHGHGEVWQVTAQALPYEERRFDAITCLWNVLGHVPTMEERVEALRRMRALLSPRGVLFLDVNHRHNARAYGLLPTLGRVLLDLVRPDPARGDVAVAWHVAGRTVHVTGHVFTTSEMAALFRAARLRVLRRHVVDYRTGQLRRSPYSGQLLYFLVPCPEANRGDLFCPGPSPGELPSG